MNATGPTPYQLPSALTIHGALFHQWLPDGRRDEIVLTPATSPNRISVWCERRTRPEALLLSWHADADGFEFDPAIMRRQYKLDAAHLLGEIRLANIDANALEALRNMRDRLAREPNVPADANYLRWERA